MKETRRDDILSFVKKEFIGPDPIEKDGYRQENGEEILLSDAPLSRYIAGILYPKKVLDTDTSEDLNLELDIDYDTETDDTYYIEDKVQKSAVNDLFENAEELINKSNAYRPSAMSITVAIKKDDIIHAEVSAGKYIGIKVPGRKSDAYARNPISWNNNESPLELPINTIKSYLLADSGLQFDITYRYTKQNYNIYTFTLENININQNISIRNEDCFFQTKFRIKSHLGFEKLPNNIKITTDDDYNSNQLLYRNVYNYAIGHGCSASWCGTPFINEIATETFPEHEIKPIVPKQFEDISLDMLRFSSDNNFDECIKELTSLCNNYEEWINSLSKESTTLDSIYKETATKHINNCAECLSRMKDGIKLLQENKTVKIAFQYMNLAMLMQQLHYNLPLQNWQDNGHDDIKLSNPIKLPQVNDKSTWYGNPNKYGHWRPFQIAFILINLRSMLDKDSNDRRIVDLIWFPTGGGKTEAYLGLSAYTIFLRKLINKDDSGTAILMRYTLRLLTAQQYERAASLICACEYIRQQHEDLFGKNTISIGLWVGQATTPNKEADAIKQYNNLYKTGTPNPFIMLKCPWCGAEMGPVKVHSHYELPGYTRIKGPTRKQFFRFKCRNSACDFSKTNLPLHIVDETIYQETPTLLLGTVDKFAMLPFYPEAQSLFGYKNGKKETSPDLIIQDELHLISGPLGSMVGLYETLINELCTSSIGDKKVSPKIIASTATISNAKEQCHSLYGCDKDDVFQFPPSGLNAGDSFFAKEDKSKNGRKYIGIMASGLSADATTEIRLYSSLLYGTKAMKVDNESDRDPYWTIIGYYNTLRELGQAETWIKSDIAEHLNVMYRRRKEYLNYPSPEEYNKNRRYIKNTVELTSRIAGSEVTESLEKLNISYPTLTENNNKIQNLPIDICLATNMISVGLDIQRLGLMTVNGQPKTTSEYIQTTSRIGRDSENAPGLVFVIYKRGRPRDKSYYENFNSYHSKIYCNVEPTSVTPFSEPAKDRALHAIIIAMLRLEGTKEYNEAAPSLPTKEQLQHVKSVILNRVRIINEEEVESTSTKIDEIFESWKNWNPKIWYSFLQNEEVPLMHFAGTNRHRNWRKQSFATPTSMRNVDQSCVAELLSNNYSAEEDDNE